MKIDSAKYRHLIKNLPDAFAYHQVIYDQDGKPEDYVFLEVNVAFEAMTGLKRKDIIGRKVTEVLPGIENVDFDWIGTFGKVAAEGTRLSFEQYSEPLKRWYDVQVYGDDPGLFITVFNEITAKKQELASMRDLLELTKKMYDSDLTAFNYQSVTDNLLKLSGAKFTAINTYENDRTKTVTRAISGIPDMIEDASKILGFEIAGQSWDIIPERLRKIEGGKLICFSNLHEAAMGSLSKTTSTMLHNLTGIRDIYVLEMAYGGRETMGDIIFFMPKEKDILNQEVIEIYAGKLGAVLGKLRAEERLRSNEQRYSQAQRFASMGTWEYILAEAKLYWSDECAELFGIKPGEFLGDFEAFLAFVHPEDRDYVIQINQPAVELREGMVLDYEHRIVRKDGSIRWVREEAGPVVDEKGKITKMVGMVIDVTEQKNAEAELKGIKANLEDLVEKRTGDLEEANLNLQREVEKRKKVVDTLLYSNNQLNVLLEISKKMAAEKEIAMLTQDIVDGLTKLTGLGLAGLFLLDGDHLTLEATNPQLPPDLPKLLRRAPLADYPYISKAIVNRQPEVIADSRTAYLSAAEKESADKGQARSTLFAPLVYKGKSIGILITSSVNEVHEFKEEEIGIVQTLAGMAALALAEAQQKKRLISFNDNSPALIGELDLNGRYLNVNRALASFFGLEASALSGSLISDLLPKETVDVFMERIDSVKRSGLPLSVEDQFYSGKDETAYFSILFPLFNSAGGIASVGSIAHDITELKQAEKKLADTLDTYRRALEGIIISMGTLMSKRDNYTAGHQLRVAQLAVAIAEELGLEETQIEGLKLAAEVHDIGKISIPAEILTKPDELTDLEYMIIQTHPQIGYEILQNIEFPWPLAEIIAQHHEKIDGSGYPKGLKGDQILLEAKIICVADVVEAMASHRPYRAARGIDAALEEIERQRGFYFDEEVANACLRLFREKGFQFEQV